MTTTFVYDGNEIEIKNEISNCTMYINGEAVDHAKGVFKPEKDFLRGALSCSDGSVRQLSVQLLHEDGVYKVKLFIDEKLMDVRYMF